MNTMKLNDIKFELEQFGQKHGKDTPIDITCGKLLRLVNAILEDEYLDFNNPVTDMFTGRTTSTIPAKVQVYEQKRKVGRPRKGRR